MNVWPEFNVTIDIVSHMGLVIAKIFLRVNAHFSS